MDPPSPPVRALATSCFSLPLSHSLSLSLTQVWGHSEATEQKASPAADSVLVFMCTC